MNIYNHIWLIYDVWPNLTVAVLCLPAAANAPVFSWLLVGKKRINSVFMAKSLIRWLLDGPDSFYLSFYFFFSFPKPIPEWPINVSNVLECLEVI